jgi:hypothetical protein
MVQRYWLFAMLLASLTCGSLIGCGAKPSEQAPVDHEQMRKQQMDRAGRESGAT